MNQRRILIGSMIGILTFTLLSWVSPNTWNVLESQLLQGRSQLRLFNPFAKVNYLVIELGGEQSDLENRSSSEQKETLMNLVSELAAREAKTITIAINKINPLDINNLDLEAAVGDFDTQARTIKVNDIDTIVEQESGPTLWLDRKQHDLKRHSIDDLFSDVIPPEDIRNQNIVIISPRLELTDEDLNLVINHLADRWVTYLPIHAVIKFALCVAIGILMAALVYWARIVTFFALGIIAMVIGQLALTLFNVQIETVSFIISLISILLLSNLFDLNLSAAISKRNFFQSKQGNANDLSDPAVIMTTPFIQVGSAAADLNPETIKELRAKFFHEQESNFEDIALEFQEKTIRSVNSVQEKIDELTESETLSERDRTKLSLLKHNFDHMIEEMDAILFNLVPFRFENDKGLVGLIELYASKLFLLSRGKLQVSIETAFPSLKLELDQKINSYRIIQRLIELIKTTNDDKASSGMVISINIHNAANGKLKFRISYEGSAVNANANNFKINEVYKRIAGLNEASIDFGTSNLTGLSKNLTNHIEFQFKTAAIRSNPKKETAVLVG